MSFIEKTRPGFKPPALAGMGGMQASIGDRSIHPDAGGVSSYSRWRHLGEVNEAQGIWKHLQEQSRMQGIANLIDDFSSHHSLVIAGRYLLPKLRKPVYWMIKDNRVVLSCGTQVFNESSEFSERDKMQLCNHILAAYASRSKKGNFEDQDYETHSAALCINEKGQMFIAMNTQEARTADWDKECAETNLSKIVKMLNAAGDRISRLYVMGFFVDKFGSIKDDKHLLPMCGRCVEMTYPVMAEDALVTAIPGNNGTKIFKLKEGGTYQKVLDNTAWQVPHHFFKGPSIISFPTDYTAMQAEAWQKIVEKKISLTELLRPLWPTIPESQLLAQALGQTAVPILEGRNDLEAINRFMVAKLAETLQKRSGPHANHAAIAVIEITDGKHKRYEFGIEVRGSKAYAVTAPVSTSTSHSGLLIPDIEGSEKVSRVFVMGYNSDGSPVNYNTEQWERLFKRVAVEDVDKVKVTFLPVNDGSLSSETLEKMALPKPLLELNNGGWRGSRQPDAHSHGCH